MRKLILCGVIAAFLSAMAVPALATRDKPSKNDPATTWAWDGGTKTANGVSADGPKSSNAYLMTPGSYVYPANYWEMPLAATSFSFSYKANELTGAGQVYWTVILEDAGSSYLFDPDYDSTTDNSFPATIVALDPFHCQGLPDAMGWALANFQRIGTDCTIYTTTGTGPWTGDGSLTGGMSAWQKLLAEHGTDVVYFTYLIQDGASLDSLTVDRVRAGGNVLSKFATDSQAPPA